MLLFFFNSLVNSSNLLFPVASLVNKTLKASSGAKDFLIFAIADVLAFLNFWENAENPSSNAFNSSTNVSGAPFLDNTLLRVFSNLSIKLVKVSA